MHNRCVRIIGTQNPLTRLGLSIIDCATEQAIPGVYRVVLDIDVERRYNSAMLFHREQEQERVRVQEIDVTAHAESVVYDRQEQTGVGGD